MEGTFINFCDLIASRIMTSLGGKNWKPHDSFSNQLDSSNMSQFWSPITLFHQT